MTGSIRLAAFIVVAWILFVALVYLPDVGQGFIKDDFVWIAAARDGLHSIASLARPRTADFFRPMVAASFVFDYFLHGLAPRPYGLTNLVLYVGCAAAIASLFRQLQLSVAAAVLGAFVWAVNPHGINMAVLWISGRTSLLLTLWSTLAAIAFLRRRRALGAACMCCALLSKEEAVALPVMIGALVAASRSDDRRGVAIDAAVMLAMLAAYLALRATTPALTPATAPWYYRPTTDVRLLARNALEYLDRGATMAVAVCLLAALACWTWPSVGRRARRLALGALVWFAAGYALTLWVPVRSSLYAVFPSIGAALMCAIVLDALERTRPTVFAGRLAGAVVAIVLCVPIYRARNDRWVEPARVSQRTMARLVQDAHTLPPSGVVIFEDQVDPVSSWRSAFGELAPEAVRLYTARPLDAYVVAPDPSARRSPVETRDVAARYRLVNGRIDRVE